MKLADWLHQRSKTPEQLRRMLGVKNRSTIHRYLSGERRPGREVLDRIEEVTEGQVTEADFVDPSPPKCAIVVLNEQGEPRLVFRWSRSAENQRRAFDSLRDEPHEWDRLTGVVTRAIRILAGRARFTKRGVFLLDGRPTDARRIVSAANEVLKAQDLPLLRYPRLDGGDEESSV